MERTGDRRIRHYNLSLGAIPSQHKGAMVYATFSIAIDHLV